MRRRNLKIMCKLLASANVNSRSYDYRNPIYSEGINDSFVYDSTDSIITIKTGIQHNY